MLPILLEDNHCLAVDKPAGLLSQGDITGDPSVLDLASDYLKRRYAKPGNVYIGLVHRLDRPTSGVLLLAKTSKAAARLSEQFRDGQVRKTYLAVVEGRWTEDAGQWEDHLLKDERENQVRTVDPDTPGARAARLDYQILDRSGSTLLIRLEPRTGRGHQLRVQLASRGLTIVGDGRYGSSTRLRATDGRSRIALHAAELEFKHPTLPGRTTIVAPLPADWPGEHPSTR